MEELDLKELLELFWHKKVKILLIVAIFVAIGVIYTVGFVTPKYTASTTVVLATSQDSSTKTNTITTSDITLNSKLVSTYSVLVKSKSVTRKVISNLGINITEDELKNEITVSSEKDTEVIRISVTNKNGTDAANIANEMAKVFTEEISRIYNINNVKIIDQAEATNTPLNINHMKDIMIFAFGGLVIAVMYVLVANMLDTTIKTAEEVEKQFKVPVLATIPLYNFEPVKVKGGKKR